MAERKNTDSSWGKRRSIFALSHLKPGSSASSHHQHLTDDSLTSASDSSKPGKTLTKKNKHSHSPSLFTDFNHPDIAEEDYIKPHLLPDQLPPGSHTRKLSPNMKGLKRPPVVFETRKSSVRTNTEESGNGIYANGEPLSAVSTKAPSLSFENAIEGTPSSRSILMHGEVQTSAGMFRKKKEYLVLTDTQIIRFKSQQRAAETFKNIPNALGRSPTSRHTAMPSAGSQSDIQTLSDSSGDKLGRLPLRQVVATHRMDDGKPYFALEVCYLDEDSSQASAINLQFSNPEERDAWLIRIRRAVTESRLRESVYISPYNLENAARIVERDNDYDPANCAIYKVIQRQPTAKSGGRSSSDDLQKVASTVCFLAIGVHKVHLVQLVKPATRSSTPSLAVPTHSQASHGILTITAVKLSHSDDAFEITFRQPLQKPKTIFLASSAAPDIAVRLAYAENLLRPECGRRLIHFNVPAEVEELLPPPIPADIEENQCLDRTLTAYCVAYGVNPTNVRYTLNQTCEDSPQFELLPPADPRRPTYAPLELLAIMRALRYNESFGSLSFANILLDSLNGLHDNYGQEHVCTRTKRGTPIRLSPEELNKSSLLVQEIRALAVTSKRLRRMDFSSCITGKPNMPDTSEDEATRMRDIGCGIVEALFPLCKHQTTNVDWICLNGIDLSDTDLDYLVGAAVDKSCHFRAIEMNRCGLNDRSLGLVLDALRTQENTLESLEIAGNGARLNPAAFDSQLGMFGFLRKLNLSQMSRTSGTEPFIQAETLSIWRLQELRLSGTSLNAATIDAVATYLAHPQSNSLRQLYLDNTYLSGADIATILHSLSSDRPEVRNMHLDLSNCMLTKGLEKVTQAISAGKTPTHLSMRAVEYREESHFRKVVAALTTNCTLQVLDMSQTALPGDASEEMCRLLSKLLAENDTLVELDLSGDDSRLATSKFGAGINDALAGLKQNSSLQVFRIERQRLGFQGASTLAEVLKENRTLLELHCDNNEIPLHGLTDLVNSLVDNTTIVFLPPMNDGRAAALRSAEATMKVMADQEPPGSPTLTKAHTFSSTSVVKKGFANVKKTAQRTTSGYAPTFPNLSSYSRSSMDSNSHRTGSPLSLTMPPSKAKHGPSSSISMPSTVFTVQDIQTTHRLLSEQWDRQCYRLEQYLYRNWCLLNDIPVNMEVEDEKFERPSSVGSIGKMLEQVKYDTTPKAEIPEYFDSPQDVVAPPVYATLPKTRNVTTTTSTTTSTTTTTTTTTNPDKHSMSFKHFILESKPKSSLDSGTRHLGLDETSDTSSEAPRTPTQNAFPAI